MPAKQLLKVAFLIEAAKLGDFVVQYADQVQGLEISPVVAVGFDKNRPTTSSPGSQRARTAAARVDVLALVREDSSLTFRDVVAKLPHLPRKWIQMRLYRMVKDGDLVKTKKGTLQLPPASASKNGAHADAGS